MKNCDICSWKYSSQWVYEITDFCPRKKETASMPNCQRFLTTNFQAVLKGAWKAVLFTSPTILFLALLIMLILSIKVVIDQNNWTMLFLTSFACLGAVEAIRHHPEADMFASLVFGNYHFRTKNFAIASVVGKVKYNGYAETNKLLHDRCWPYGGVSTLQEVALKVTIPHPKDTQELTTYIRVSVKMVEHTPLGVQFPVRFQRGRDEKVLAKLLR